MWRMTYTHNTTQQQKRPWRERRENRVKSIPLNQKWNVAVSCRNWTLLFWPHYRVQSIIAQNFHYGRGSYTLRRLIRYSYIFAAHMSPILNESSVLKRFEHNNTKWNNVRFPPWDCHKWYFLMDRFSSHVLRPLLPTLFDNFQYVNMEWEDLWDLIMCHAM